MWCSCFLFFKQKTAYEVRISDWSSDGCSSDLEEALHPGGVVLRTRLRRAGVARRRAYVKLRRHVRLLGCAEHVLGVGRADGELGRASCRESVCQYVSISVDAVA